MNLKEQMEHEMLGTRSESNKYIEPQDADAMITTAISVARRYTKGFAEWLTENSWIRYSKTHWIQRGSNGDTITTSELLKLYDDHLLSTPTK